MGVAAENAFEQSGRKPVLVTAASGECAAFAYWKANPGIPRWPRSIHRRRLPTRPSTLPIGCWSEKPVLNTLLYPIPRVTNENFDQFYHPSMTVSSLCYPRSPDGRAVPDSYFNVLFTGGKPVGATPLPAKF